MELNDVNGKDKEKSVMMMFTCLTLMIKCISYCQGFENTAWLVVVLLNALYEMKYFLIVVFLVLAFFTASFFSLFAGMMPNDDLYDDDTAEPLKDRNFVQGGFMMLFDMGLIGTYSRGGFDQTADDGTYANLVFFCLMIFLQIVVLNALIAYLGESFNRVLATKEAKVTLSLANLMVEYMDCWKGPWSCTKEVSREHALQGSKDKADGGDSCCCERSNSEKKVACMACLYRNLKFLWISANGGTLEDLQRRSMWTHRLKVSNTHEQQATTSDKIYSLLLEQRADMDSKFHGFKKDLDYVKNELLEVRKTKELQKDMSKYDPALKYQGHEP